MKRTPTLRTRRQFLRTSALGAAASWTLPIFLEKTFFTLNALAADALTQTATGKDSTILVVLQLAGGNDGLNTVIPFADPTYYALRKNIGIKREQMIQLDERTAEILGMQEQHGLAVRADLGHAVAEHPRTLLDQCIA